MAESAEESQSIEEVSNNIEIKDTEDITIKEDNEAEGEQLRLGGYKPLTTILIQSIGPLLQQVVSATYGIVDTFYVGKVLGKNGLSAIGSAATLEAICHGMSQYLATCTSSKLGFLYGQKRNDECAQVVCDLLRFAVIYSIVCMGVILPVIKPLVSWMGADKSVTDDAFIYLVPLSAGGLVLDLYMILCGVLQSEGRSHIYGICQICSMLLNMLVFNPIFLLKFKTGIWGASLSSLISSFIPLFCVSIPLWMGKFTVKPQFSMLFNKFSPETFSALKIGLSSLIGLLSGCLPMIVIQKYMGSWGSEQGIFNEVNSSFTVLIRVVNLIIAVDTALAQGLLPCASFAFGAQRINRLMWLSVHDFWLGTLWNAVCETVIICNGRRIAKIMLDDETFLGYCEEFLKMGLYAIFLAHIQFVCSVMLQATKQVKYASIQALATQLFPIPVFGTIIYFADKTKKPVNLILSFVSNDVFSFIVCVIFIWLKLGFIFYEEASDAIPLDVNKEKDNNEEESHVEIDEL